jgi:hypothetical protein
LVGNRHLPDFLTQSREILHNRPQLAGDLRLHRHICILERTKQHRTKRFEVHTLLISHNPPDQT